MAGLIFGGAYYWKEFCVSKWVGLVNKNSLKQLTLKAPRLIQEGLLLEGFLRLRFGELIFGRAYFFCGDGGLLWKFYSINCSYHMHIYFKLWLLLQFFKPLNPHAIHPDTHPLGRFGALPRLSLSYESKMAPV